MLRMVHARTLISDERRDVSSFTLFIISRSMAHVKPPSLFREEVDNFC